MYVRQNVVSEISAQKHRATSIMQITRQTSDETQHILQNILFLVRYVLMPDVVLVFCPIPWTPIQCNNYYVCMRSLQ